LRKSKYGADQAGINFAGIRSQSKRKSKTKQLKPVLPEALALIQLRPTL